ncbi:MAG: hypothetical protein RIM80_17190 [Alphaproteobacteria bacterium]
MSLRKKFSKRLRDLSYARIPPSDRYQPGEAKWLIAAEKELGGFVKGLARRKPSPLDSRSPAELAKADMRGGDRMFHHRYAAAYSRHLAPFVANRSERYVVVETGILRGTGLALWSRLFPEADIIGCDIDLEYTRDNLDALRARGAFQRRPPELHLFDQLADDAARAQEILDGRTIDIFIDDGIHTDVGVRRTLASFGPYMSKRAVYFIEDMPNGQALVADDRTFSATDFQGELTVLSRGF